MLIGGIGVRLKIPESQEQAEAVAYLRLRGYAVWRIGQRNAKGTQDAGVPDVVAIHPAHGLLWYECKREGGRQSPAQHAFEAACREAGVRYICGTCRVLIAALGG